MAATLNLNFSKKERLLKPFKETKTLAIIIRRRSLFKLFGVCDLGFGVLG